MPPLRGHSWAKEVSKRVCKAEVRKTCRHSTSMSCQPREKQELRQWEGERMLWHPLGQGITHEAARLLQETLLPGQSPSFPSSVDQGDLQSFPLEPGHLMVLQL